MHSALAEYMVLVSPWMHECASYIYSSKQHLHVMVPAQRALYHTYAWVGHMHGHGRCKHTQIFVSLIQSIHCLACEPASLSPDLLAQRLQVKQRVCPYAGSFWQKKETLYNIYIYVYTHTDANIFGCLFHKWGYLNGFVIMDTIINFMI